MAHPLDNPIWHALRTGNQPAMLALTALTNPGLLLARTIEFGGYHGVFQDDQLVAMAGQRLQPTPYTEISAVCTHPAHLGHEYVRQIVQQQLGLILVGGHTPFLHMYEDNTPVPEAGFSAAPMAARVRTRKTGILAFLSFVECL